MESSIIEKTEGHDSTVILVQAWVKDVYHLGSLYLISRYSTKVGYTFIFTAIVIHGLLTNPSSQGLVNKIWVL